MIETVIINGSYRKDGVSDQMVEMIEKTLSKNNNSYKTFNLREKDIKYCTNCRVCMQEKGQMPMNCTIDDEMKAIVSLLEEAKNYVFISPTNFGTVTSLFKCFLERLGVYGYYPWGEHAPKFRKKPTKKALCLSSCAAPSLIAWLFFDTMKPLKYAAKCVGANVVNTHYIGIAAKEKNRKLTKSEKDKLSKLANKLIK